MVGFLLIACWVALLCMVPWLAVLIAMFALSIVWFIRCGVEADREDNGG